MVGRFLSANGEILSFIYPQKSLHSINWLGLLDDMSKVNDNFHLLLYLRHNRKAIEQVIDIGAYEAVEWRTHFSSDRQHEVGTLSEPFGWKIHFWILLTNGIYLPEFKRKTNRL